MMNSICDYLDEIIPNPVCELNYAHDYELLIATVLSAQCTDKRVNETIKFIFNKYVSIEELNDAEINDIKEIIRPCGSFNKKSEYIKEIAKKLIEEQNGKVPNDYNFLIKLPGVGRKTINVVTSELFNTPTIAVDTHVERVSKRLNLVKNDDDVIRIEKKLMKKIDKENWNRVNHQLVLFGRYFCKAKNPNCIDCKLKKECKFYEKNIKS